MGGSGSGSSGFTSRGGGGIGGGGRHGGSRFDCEDFTAKAAIRSPKKEIIKTISHGDILFLTLENRAAPILVVTDDGEIAGSLVVPEQADLVRCINKGNQYIAIVEKIEGGTCIVYIQSAEEDE